MDSKYEMYSTVKAPRGASQSSRDQCLNCGQLINGNFCAHCGQQNKDNTERSLGKLLGDLLTNIFFFDNRLWLSLRYLFFKPGEMSCAYLEGKRKRFLAPIPLFLLANLLYFFANPITDYSLPLYDQMHRQIHSPLSRELVKERLADRKVSIDEYTLQYNNASLNISKSIMIANVPIFALFLWPMFYRRSRYYYDSLIFGLHYFTLFLSMLVITHWLNQLMIVVGIPLPEAFMLLVGVLILPYVFGVLSVRAFGRFRWFFALLGGVGIILALFLAQFVYRALIFFVTFWST